MKKSITLISSMIIVSIALTGQTPIIINHADMPVVGDTFRYHISPSLLNIDLNQTGANQIWDFSNLQSISDYLDQYISVQSTGLIYSFAFWQSDNALKLNFPDTMGQIPLQDIYNFYKINGGDYEISGFGASISGMQIPVKYSSPDVLYTFPLTYGTSDSSNISFAISIPTIGGYTRIQKRVNHTDGWGTLTAPGGNTYNVLRTVSRIDRVDTLISTLGKFGYANTQLEYKWISKTEGVPIVEVKAQEILGQVIPFSIIYYQKPTTIPSGLTQNQLASQWQVYPNPVQQNFQLMMPAGLKQIQEISLLNANGSMVQRFAVVYTKPGAKSISLSLNRATIPAGFYWIKTISDGKTAVLPLIVH